MTASRSPRRTASPRSSAGRARDSMGQKMMGSVVDIEAVDAKTFKMTMKEPYGLVLQSLGKPSSNVPFMMPKKTRRNRPDAADQGRGRDRLRARSSSRPTNGSRARRRLRQEPQVQAARRAAPRAWPAARWSSSTASNGWPCRTCRPQVDALQNGEIDMIESPRPRPAAAAGQGQEHQAGELQPARQPVHLPLQQRCQAVRQRQGPPRRARRLRPEGLPQGHDRRSASGTRTARRCSSAARRWRPTHGMDDMLNGNFAKAKRC